MAVGRWYQSTNLASAGDWVWDTQLTPPVADKTTFELTAGNTQVKLNQAGTYLVIANVLSQAISQGQRCDAELDHLGPMPEVIDSNIGFGPSAGTNYVTHHLSGVVQAAAGDTIRVAMTVEVPANSPSAARFGGVQWTNLHIVRLF